jgi:hypothetical protein
MRIEGGPYCVSPLRQLAALSAKQMQLHSARIFVQGNPLIDSLDECPEVLLGGLGMD